MQAVQRLVLLSPALDAFTSRDPVPDPTYGAVNLVASAFARYSYPEAFFLWNRERGGPRGRCSSTAATARCGGTRRGPGAVSRDRRRARARSVRRCCSGSRTKPRKGGGSSSSRSRWRASPTRWWRGCSTATCSARIWRRSSDSRSNLDWARQHYFPALLDEAASAARAGEGVAIAIADERDQPVAGALAAVIAPGAPTSDRTFPLMFFNPVIAAADPPAKLQRRSWTVRAATRVDSSLLLASADANRMLVLGLVAAATLAIGIALSVRAARARLRLAELRADFVASVTHEFKTPIATIRAAGDTLVADRLDGRRRAAGLRPLHRPRIETPDPSRRQSPGLHPGHRHAGRAAAAGTGGPRGRGRGITGPLRRAAGGRRVSRRRGGAADAAAGPGRPDRAGADARQSGGQRDPPLAGRTLAGDHGASVAGRFVVLEVSDRGGGIPPDEVRHVTQKFYRGRLAGHGGTGLGLAIAARIVDDHRGTLKIDSEPGVGTTMRIAIPAAPVQPARRRRSLRRWKARRELAPAHPGGRGRSPAGQGRLRQPGARRVRGAARRRRALGGESGQGVRAGPRSCST